MAPRRTLKPRKTPRQARARATVEAILSAAAQVLQRKGYAAATTDRIAERAGVSVGSLYQYFPNKDAILVALAERHIDEGFALVRELVSESLRERPTLRVIVRRFVSAMFALHEHEPELHRVLFEEVPLPASLRRSLRERENAFAEEVRALLAAHPETALPEPRVTAYLLVQTVDAVVHNFVLHPPTDISRRELADELVDMMMRHIATT